jgi:putative ABC transport system permease protein
MPRWTRFRRMFGLDPAGDVEAELSFHLEMRTRELLDRGEPLARARSLAERRFGDVEIARRACVEINERRRRRITVEEYMTELVADIKYALRTLWRTPSFTLVALLTLGLGIGANSAIFSVVHGVLFESLPYRDIDRLHHVRILYPDGTAYAANSAPDFMSIRESSRTFDRVEAYTRSVATLLGHGEPREIEAINVSDGFLELLGVPITSGRGFTKEEYVTGRGNVVVLTNGFWAREFGSDPSVIGRTISLAGRSGTIVGALGPSATLPMETDVIVPIEYGETFNAATARGRRSEFLYVIGRARSEAGPGHINDDLRRIGTELQVRFPNSNNRLTFDARLYREEIVGDTRVPLLVMQGAVAFVLLIACANVANLLLVRGAARQGELAVRAALGAGRRRLIRQLLTESAVLGAVGGLLGLAIAFAATRAFVQARPADVPGIDHVDVDATVVAFTLGIALVTSVVLSIIPALRATSAGLATMVREGGRGHGPGRRGARLRETLVVAQVTLAIVLLTGAGLLIRSFVKLTQLDPGFRTEHAMAFRIALQGDAYREPAVRRTRIAELESRLRALPGVTAAGSTTSLPFSGVASLIDFQVVGAPPPPPNVNQEIAISSASAEYFQAIGATFRRGRLFTDRDHAEAPRVAIINEMAVRRWFPDRDPLGARVNMSGNEYEVVGVIRDLPQRQPPEAPIPQIFVPYLQRSTRAVQVVVRSASDPLSLGGAIREAVRSLDATLPIGTLTPLEQVVARSTARPRFYTALLTLFAGTALALAAAGIFGVISYGVSQRTREISIRIALGARSAEVLRAVVGRTAMSIAIGLLVGIPAAIALGLAIRGQLFGIALWDPPTIIGVLLVLTASAAVASLFPVRRALRLDPAKALREG